MKYKNFALIVLSAAILSGCAGAEITQLSDRQLPSRPDDCNIQVFATDPKQEFEEIAIVTAKGGQTIFEGSDMDTMLPLMKTEACRVGADGLILKNAAGGGMNWVGPKDRGNASGVAIKLKTARSAASVRRQARR